MHLYLYFLVDLQSLNLEFGFEMNCSYHLKGIGFVIYVCYLLLVLNLKINKFCLQYAV